MLSTRKSWVGILKEVENVVDGEVKDGILRAMDRFRRIVGCQAKLRNPLQAWREREMIFRKNAEKTADENEGKTIPKKIGLKKNKNRKKTGVSESDTRSSADYAAIPKAVPADEQTARTTTNTLELTSAAAKKTEDGESDLQFDDDDEDGYSFGVGDGNPEFEEFVEVKTGDDAASNRSDGIKDVVFEDGTSASETQTDPAQARKGEKIGRMKTEEASFDEGEILGGVV